MADVHVFGASYATSGAIREAIHVATGREVVMHGITGATLDRWAERIPAPGSLSGDDVFVLELGGNGVPTPAAVAAADAALHATGARVRWFVLSDWPDALHRAARRAAAVSVRAGARSVVTVPGPTLAQLSGDRTHLTTTGYARLGSAMARALTSAMARVGSVSPVALAVVGVLAFVAWRVCR